MDGSGVQQLGDDQESSKDHYFKWQGKILRPTEEPSGETICIQLLLSTWTIKTLHPTCIVASSIHVCWAPLVIAIIDGFRSLDPLYKHTLWHIRLDVDVFRISSITISSIKS